MAEAKAHTARNTSNPRFMVTNVADTRKKERLVLAKKMLGARGDGACRSGVGGRARRYKYVLAQCEEAPVSPPPLLQIFITKSPLHYCTTIRENLSLLLFVI